MIEIHTVGIECVIAFCAFYRVTNCQSLPEKAAGLGLLSTHTN